MKRQIAKGLAMLMVTLVLAAASAVVANGQQKAAMAAEVPFEFVVADQILRAGDYRVRTTGQAADLIAISNSHGDSAVRNTTSCERRGKLDAKLVFHRYGSTYFLSQIWMAGEATGRQLLKSKQERASERELKIASNGGRTYDIVEVVAIAR
jgi:hypothetical protein